MKKIHAFLLCFVLVSMTAFASGGQDASESGAGEDVTITILATWAGDYPATVVAR